MTTTRTKKEKKAEKRCCCLWRADGRAPKNNNTVALAKKGFCQAALKWGHLAKAYNQILGCAAVNKGVFPCKECGITGSGFVSKKVPDVWFLLWELHIVYNYEFIIV